MKPHEGQPLLTVGEPLASAEAAMILIHGRGASAESILTLVSRLDGPGFAFLAPQAAESTWYPHSFLAPIPQNEPGISSGLYVISQIMADLDSKGILSEKIMLLGFSQGACLTLEFAARNPKRYGGIVGLSGGLIGPEGTPRDYGGSLDGTAIFLGCSDVDTHIPKERVHETTTTFKKMGAYVTERLYPNMGHTVNHDEVEFVQRMMEGLKRNS